MTHPSRGAHGLLLLIIVTWLAFCSCITAKEPRYLFFALPALALAILRIGLAEGDTWSLKRATLRGYVFSGLVLLQLLRANDAAPRPLPRMTGAVAVLAGRPDADVVLVDAVRDGQFIFDLYDDGDTRDKIIPLRASKLLYARAARERYGYRQFVDAPEDIVALLDRYGVRYVVIESDLPKTPYVEADPPPRKMLRTLLETDSRFEQKQSWPLECGDGVWDAVRLRLYRYKTTPSRQTDTITLPMPSMGRDLTLTLPPASRK